MTLKVGPFSYSKGGVIEFGRYGSGEIAIQIFNRYGEPEATATVSLVPYGAPHPGERGIYLKDWSENEGVVQALVDAGIIELTGKGMPTGYCVADHAVLTDKAWEELRKQEVEHAKV
jgi:hypothetical protein